MQKIPMTLDGYNRIEAELKRLKSVERPEIIKAIAAARETEKLGCSVHVASPVPRTTNVVVDCPADRASDDGSRRVRKGVTELNVNAASMQSVWIDLRRAGRRESVDAERVGDCKP